MIKKAPLFFRSFFCHMRTLDKISVNLLVYGQGGIILAMCAALLRLIYLYTYNAKTPFLFTHTLADVKLFLENTSFAVCLLWGGALLFDYMRKKEGK